MVAQEQLEIELHSFVLIYCHILYPIFESVYDHPYHPSYVCCQHHFCCQDKFHPSIRNQNHDNQDLSDFVKSYPTLDQHLQLSLDRKNDHDLDFDHVRYTHSHISHRKADLHLLNLADSNEEKDLKLIEVKLMDDSWLVEMDSSILLIETEGPFSLYREERSLKVAQ